MWFCFSVISPSSPSSSSSSTATTTPPSVTTVTRPKGKGRERSGRRLVLSTIIIPSTTPSSRIVGSSIVFYPLVVIWVWSLGRWWVWLSLNIVRFGCGFGCAGNILRFTTSVLRFTDGVLRFTESILRFSDRAFWSVLWFAGPSILRFTDITRFSTYRKKIKKLI